MPNVMLAYHDQWDKVSVAMTCGAGISRDKILTHSSLGQPQTYPKYTTRDQGRHKNIETSYTSRKSVAPARYRILSQEVDIDNMTIEEYARYELTMSTMKSKNSGAANLRKMKHEIPNRYDNITDYVDSDQEDGELPDLPTFSATNEFASDSEQVKENIDTAEEKEEVPMDENNNIDHPGTKEALQWSLAKDSFLVIMELNDQ
uniref:Uncharacterized protein n=1 Tax=Tanacetum cinerariifolium TaxID=118510 RepID=A0A699HJD4_TANCI|nr:hypothetical protein [Tanacetum cinerariifolium]